MQEIYQQVNQFRSNPSEFLAERGWPNRCTHALDVAYPPLSVSRGLEAAAHWSATHQCEPIISHETCPVYCGLFGGSCSYQDRIAHFVDVRNPGEILVKGPKRPLKNAINKQGHCNHLLNPDIDMMGGAIVGNLFMLAFGKAMKKSLERGNVRRNTRST